MDEMRCANLETICDTQLEPTDEVDEMGYPITQEVEVPVCEYCPIYDIYEPDCMYCKKKKLKV